MSKNRIDFSNVTQLRKKMFSRLSWVKISKLQRDLKCTNCKVEYTSLLDEHISACSTPTSTIKAICNSCADKMEEFGIVDLNVQIEENKRLKQALISKIVTAYPKYKNERGSNQYRTVYLADLKMEELQAILKMEDDIIQKAKDLENAIKNEYVETETEPYLLTDYDIYESEWLKHETEIKDYFSDNYEDWIEGGIGEYVDEATVIVKIGAKFYEVDIVAEMGATNKDLGVRRFYVEDITSVTWKEIPKPLPKPRTQYTFTANLTEWEYNQIVNKFDGLNLTDFSSNEAIV